MKPCFSQFWADDRACVECDLIADCRQVSEVSTEAMDFERAKAEVAG